MSELDDSKETVLPRSRVTKGSNRVLYLFIFTILALTGGFFFYQKNILPLQQPIAQSESGAQSGEDGDTSNQQTATTNTSSTANSVTSSNQLNQTEIAGPASSSESLSTHLSTGQETEVQAVHVSQNTDTTEDAHYQDLITKLNNFYSHLDTQQYMQDFKLSESSKDHFSKLIQNLIDNPPVVTRETDDLFTLLKNTAHFFRVIGKSNILILKGILDREKASFESILQAFYTLTNKPEYLKDAYSISLDTDALYDYAGFFLNTMGGRLYLFRRDSNSRMAVSYYAILIIDRANDSGDSRHGIDIRPAVDSLIEEIENGGNNLQLRDTYLDTLYDLKEKYNS
ncbi:MAG: hypothetical protein ACI8ZB_000946 [Desulforhopalus sp.]|jgi:hypothetical protein